MKIYSFTNDYSEGAHDQILTALLAANGGQQAGYGEDTYSQEAGMQIRQHINNPDADVHFIASGTLTNLTIISSILRPFESVIAPDTAHINVHEAGAIEAIGHKINSIPSPNGKLTPELIEPILASNSNEHTVKPKMVCISNCTETGGIYNKEELTKLYSYCRANNLFLYMDGARLATALTSKFSDLSMAELSNLVDVFYIGGTKNGALLGEAVVINHDQLKGFFRHCMKQKGALLAKGRVLGIQFKEFFRDNLYYRLGYHANAMANILTDAFRKSNCQFLAEPQSNMIFPILPNSMIYKLQEKYDFYIWKKIDNENSAVRLVTSWATEPRHVESFVQDFEHALCSY